MRALITGVCGFSGAHLACYLQEAGDAVTGLDRPGAADDRLRRYGVGLEPVRADLADPEAIAAATRDVAPDVVYHLAGLSGPQGLKEMLDANVVCTANLLEAACALERWPRMFLVSSAGVYGRVPPSQQPIGEDRPLRPVGPYAVSKAAMELVGQDYWLRRGLEVVVARTFNLVGGGAPEERLVGTVQRQLAEIAAGRHEPVLQLGDLSAQRDYIEIEQAVAAYRAIAVRGTPGEVYNVCTGKARTVRGVVEGLIAESGLTDVAVAADPARVRAGEVEVSVGDPAKLMALLGE